jgi:hypothetical protein
MDEASKKIVRSILDQMLDDPTAEYQLFRGMKQTGGSGERKEFKPTEAKTVVLTTNGGSNNVSIRSIETEDD